VVAIQNGCGCAPAVLVGSDFLGLERSISQEFSQGLGVPVVLDHSVFHHT
jgi:hypothetical protein